MFASIALVDSPQALQEKMTEGKSYMVFSGENFPFETIKAPDGSFWMGGMFPALFSSSGVETAKAFVCELSKDASLHYLASAEEVFSLERQSYLVVVNGLNPKVSIMLEKIFENTPVDSVLFGGGAGCITKKCATPLFNGDQYCQEGAVLVGSSKKFHTDSKHGYDTFSSFSVVSKAHENTIVEIDFRKAFEVYQETMLQEMGVAVTPENIFQMGIKHPLIFERAFGEKTVRVPVATDGKRLWLAGDVMQDTVVSLGVTSKEKLLAAAASCVGSVVGQIDGPVGTVFIFDCAGRKEYLGDAFGEEVEKFKEAIGSAVMVGILAMGEVSNISKNSLELCNSTCVVGAY